MSGVRCCLTSGSTGEPLGCFEMSPKEKTAKSEKVGGLAYFTSLFFLLVLALSNTIALLQVARSSDPSVLTAYLISVGAGVVIARLLVRNHPSVFVHELKHSIVSNLAGNRAKGMKIRRRRGHFEYEYTKRTAAYNAFIYLAPYYFPLCTVGCSLIALAAFTKSHPALFAAALGVGWGADLELGVRDIGPHQSDFTSLRGGYSVGVIYVSAMNVVIGSIVFAAAVSKTAGLIILAQVLWHRVEFLVHTVR